MEPNEVIEMLKKIREFVDELEKITGLIPPVIRLYKITHEALVKLEREK